MSHILQKHSRKLAQNEFLTFVNMGTSELMKSSLSFVWTASWERIMYVAALYDLHLDFSPRTMFGTNTDKIFSDMSCLFCKVPSNVHVKKDTTVLSCSLSGP